MSGSVRYQIIIGNKISDSGSVSYTETTWQELVVATGSTDTALNFGGITTAELIYLKSNQELTLNINSNSGTNITIKANKPFSMTGTSVTAAYVSNSSGTDANVAFRIWGV
jgi:hypothetical protein